MAAWSGGRMSPSALGVAVRQMSNVFGKLSVICCVNSAGLKMTRRGERTDCSSMPGSISFSSGYCDTKHFWIGPHQIYILNFLLHVWSAIKCIERYISDLVFSTENRITLMRMICRSHLPSLYNGTKHRWFSSSRNVTIWRKEGWHLYT